jgi:ribosomal protein S18 acetylase RimI-like enzyme
MNLGKSGNINTEKGLELYIFDTEKLGYILLTNFDLSVDVNPNLNDIFEKCNSIQMNNTNSIYCYDFHVNEKHRGKGVGTKLLNEVIKFSKLQEIQYIFLTCNILNYRAKKLYDNFGFIELEKNQNEFLLYYLIPPN